MTEKKLLRLLCIIIGFAFIIEIRMIKIMCGDYYKLAEEQDIKSIDICAGRVDFVDCNLNNITGNDNQIIALITSETDINDIVKNIREEDKDKFYDRLKSESQVMVNLEKSVNSDAIYTVSKRYSSWNLAQNLIGYTDYQGNGICGLEKAFDSKLKQGGSNITLNFNINGNGEIYGNVFSQPAKEVDVLSLTIDNAVQRMCESVAKEYVSNGAIVIMESKTGKIRALSSSPSYDYNHLSDYLNMADSPMVNKALQCFEPGSVIKPLWAAALLSNGVKKEYVYDCKGYTEVNGHIYHCANNTSHGEVNLEKALTVSCNCYFIDSSIKNKGYVFKQFANQVNFGKSLELCDGFYTQNGAFPSIDKIVDVGVLSSVCFGQGTFLVSPLHAVAYMNIFANNGTYVYPQIAEGIYDLNTGKLKECLYKFNSKNVISSGVANTIKGMLQTVVEEGAHSRAKPDNFRAGGKTGTAQTGKRNEDNDEIFTSWFCGFYPADNPEYTICITMYDGGESSVNTAPVFKVLCDNLYYLKFYNKDIKTVDKE